MPPPDVDDVVIEAWMDAARHRDEIHTDAKLRSWLKKAVEHKATDFFRRRARRILAQSIGSLREVPRDRRKVDRASYKEERDELAAILNKLHRENPKDAWLLCAHYLKGRKLKELAKECGLTVNAVRSRISRAMQALRRLAGEEDKQ